MKIMVTDDEKIPRNRICRLIQKVLPESELRAFGNPLEAIETVKAGDFWPDVAFLDIEMFGMNGLELAKRLKDIHPSVGVIFVTAYPQYAIEAFSLHPQGYLLKPITTEQIQGELEWLRQSDFYGLREKDHLYIQCFGNFEVMADGVPLAFRYQKCKELLAYLIDRRGAMVNMTELCGVLWEERPQTRSLHGQLRKLIGELKKTLKAVGEEKILLKRRNEIGMLTEAIRCDYYDYLKGDSRAVNIYRGEYMTNYSWAEMTVGYLERARNGEAHSIWGAD